MKTAKNKKVKFIIIPLVVAVSFIMLICINNSQASPDPTPGPEVTSIGFIYNDGPGVVLEYKVYGLALNDTYYWDPGDWTETHYPTEQAIWLSRYYKGLYVYYRYKTSAYGDWTYGQSSTSDDPYIDYFSITFTIDEIED